MNKFKQLVIRVQEEIPKSVEVVITEPSDPKGAWWMTLITPKFKGAKLYEVRWQPGEPFKVDDSRNTATSGEAPREKFKSVDDMMVKLRAVCGARRKKILTVNTTML